MYSAIAFSAVRMEKTVESVRRQSARGFLERVVERTFFSLKKGSNHYLERENPGVRWTHTALSAG